MVASGGSDSSAQVLRNSRPEFRPPDASTYGFITEMLIAAPHMNIHDHVSQRVVAGDGGCPERELRST